MAPWHGTKLDETFSLPPEIKTLIFRVNSLFRSNYIQKSQCMIIWGNEKARVVIMFLEWYTRTYKVSMQNNSSAFSSSTCICICVHVSLILSSLAWDLKSQVFLLKQSISLDIFCQTSLSWWPRNKCDKRKRDFAR